MANPTLQTYNDWGWFIAPVAINMVMESEWCMAYRVYASVLKFSGTRRSKLLLIQKISMVNIKIGDVETATIDVMIVEENRIWQWDIPMNWTEIFVEK